MYVTGVNMAAASEEQDKQVLTAYDDDQMMHQQQRPQLSGDVKRLNRIYKSEHILCDSSSSMSAKVRALIDTWNELSELVPHPTKDSILNLTRFLLAHTLDIVLTVKWMKYRIKNYVPLERGIQECMKRYQYYPEFYTVCTKLLTLIKNPWAKSIIKEILTSEHIESTQREYDFFVYEESAYIILMRLKKLCEDNCSDMALNLTRSYLNCCEWADFQNFSMFISDNQKKFVFDIYLSLLYQHDDTVEISNLLKRTEVTAGIEVVRRFAGKVASKLWENNIFVAKLCGTIFLTRCVMLPFDESAHYLAQLLDTWMPMFVSDDNNEELIGSLRRIMKNALTAGHMYLFTDHLSSRYGLKMRPYCVEVCIQALNTDLNVLERIKTENPMRANEYSTRVADGFLRLADQFVDNLLIARECVLTSFSLQPTSTCFTKIEDMARASGFQVLDTGQWRCKLHPPAEVNEEVLIKCELCNEYMSHMALNPALQQSNLSLSEEMRMNNMGLSSELCDDLLVILFCARYHMLNWMQRWPELHRLCVMYLNDPIGTKNLITELKYVEIDYTPFIVKQERLNCFMEEDVDVIGMEVAAFTAQYRSRKRRRIMSESETDTENNASSSAADSSDKCDKKSDPEVLKTLKTFRRCIKSDVDVDILPGDAIKQESTDAEGTSADSEYDFFDKSSSPTLQLMDPEEEYDMQLQVPNTFETEVEMETNMNGTHENHDLIQEKPRQEFGNFQHDAENYEIDRQVNNSVADDANSKNSACQCDDQNNSSDSSSSQNPFSSLKAMYKIKECRILLTRCDRKEVVSKKAMRHRGMRFCKTKVQVSTDNKTKMLRRSSENVVQSDVVKGGNLPVKLPLRISNRINRKEDMEKLKRQMLTGQKKHPVVVLKRLEDACMESLLARVPGLYDREYFQPSNTNNIVNVVQVAGNRPTSTQSNTQTSTQVSPHIQRIGQPRNEKNDVTNNSPETTSSNAKVNNVKPTTTQSSTLINILSQQIMRPSMSNNIRNRSGNLINIISQPAIKTTATTPTVVAKMATAVPSNEVTQLSNSTKVIASGDQQQIINQIVANRAAGGTVKAVVGPSNSETGRIVQFICKSTDGKLIPVTSFPSNRLVKIGTSNATATTQPIANATADSNSIDDFTKLAATKQKTDATEVSETLPKFQQAFGKSVYQSNSTENATNATTTNNTNNTDTAEKCKPQTTPSKISTNVTTVNVQPLQGGVIYTRQVPVGQTINLIQQNRGQVFRIATTNSEQISLVKDTTIHNKMSALLAAALQGKAKSSEAAIAIDESNGDNSTTATRVQIARPLVQNARIVKPVVQIPANVIRNAPQANLSSTTLEQLREFDMVYKQVKERSSSTPADNNTPATEAESPPQRINVTYLNQAQKLNCSPVVVVTSYNSLQPAASPALSVASQGSTSPCVTPAPAPTTPPVLPKVASKGSKGKTVKNQPVAAKTAALPKPQQKPQEDEHTAQRIYDILAEYAEQLRNSPDLNNKPAPRRRSNPPTNPSQNSKRKKSSSSKKSRQSSLSTEDVEDHRTVGSEDSSCGVVQLSMQEDESTATVVTTTETSESPKSMTATTPRQQLILTDSTHNRNLIIADSSVGEALKMPNTAVLVPGNYIMPVSMVKSGQQIAVVSGGSKILATVPARSGPNMLLFQSFLNQNRKTTNVPSVKYSTIQPISGISSHSLTGVTAQPPVIIPQSSHGIGTVTLSQPIAIKKFEDTERVGNEQQLLLTISQSSRDANTVSVADEATVQQPDSSTSGLAVAKGDIDDTTAISEQHTEKTFNFQKQINATPIATSVIAQTIKEDGNSNDKIDEIASEQTIMTLDINPPFTKVETNKTEERVQSVLVTAGASNGPMLSHSPPQYKQSDCNNSSETTKDEFLRNGGKRNDKVQNAVYCVQTKTKKSSSRMDREVQQMCLQRRQAAIERELRLQKSLSEECEDLGVDEPSTSDLFPEALLFDANNSPSFDQSSQDTLKRSVTASLAEKEENKLPLFADDDFIFETSQYDANDTQLCYEEVVDSQILSNGQGGAPEDTTLLQTCTSMSDVTLSSPISPDTYNVKSENYNANKYMHKYTNKKKNEKVIRPCVDNWSGDVSSSDDTTGSTEPPEENCLDKPPGSEDDFSDGSSFQVVRIALKNECNESHCLGEEIEIDDSSSSGRGARRTIKKKCSCCNGSEDTTTINLNINTNANATLNINAARKRPGPAIQQSATSPHKKAFPSKKR